MILDLFWQCGICFKVCIHFQFQFHFGVCLYVYILFFQVIVWSTIINSSLVLLTTITMAEYIAVRSERCTGVFGGFLQVVDTVTWMENINEEGVACPQGMDWPGMVGKVLAILWKAPIWWYEGLDMNHYLLLSFYVMDCILTIFTIK